MIRYNPAAPRGIVWLASYPKSGNTWLRMVLYQLDRVRRGSPREADELSKMEEATLAETKFISVYERVLGKPLAAASPAEIVRARAPAQAAIAARFRGVVMLKTHYVLGRVDGAPTINQGASCGAIYLIRDPRDVVLSLANHMGEPVDEAISVINSPDAGGLAVNESSRIAEAWKSWSMHVDSWTTGADDSLLVVRYEDMLRQPAETFGRIVRHLRKAATPAQIAEAIESSSFAELRGQEERFGFHDRPSTAERFFVAGKAGRWRDELTAAQVAMIEKAHGPTMARFGYLDS